jgi:lysophospholipase L1-like esterase
MSAFHEIAGYRVAQAATVLFAPLLMIQGKVVRHHIPQLTEAAGERHGRIQGSGDDSVSFAVIGESTAVGVGVDRQSEGLAGQLANQLANISDLNVTWQVSGRSGATIQMVLDTYLSPLTFPVDLAIVVTGVNDVLRFTSESKWRAGILAIKTELLRRGAKHVVFTAPPPIGSFPALPQPLRFVLGARARRLDTLAAGLLSQTTGSSYATSSIPPIGQYFARDGFHPSKEGYHMWAQQIAAHLAKFLPTRQSS